MDFLNPALFIGLAGALFLSGINIYLYSHDREKYLLTWAISWVVYSLRLILQLLSARFGPSNYLILGEMLATWVSGILLVWGSFQFLGRKMPGWAIVLTILGSAFGGIAILASLSFEQITWSTFILLGAIYIWTGVTLLRSTKFGGPGKLIIGWTFILWGVHKLDYPLLRPSEWFAPWGFLIASLLTFTVGLGMILIYYYRIRQELSHSESRFRSLFNHAPMSYHSLDINGFLLEANHTWLEMLGYARNEVIGRHFRDFLPSEYQAQFQQAFEEFKTIGEVHGVEFELMRKDGTCLPVSADGKISYTEQGEFDHAHCILQDITGLRMTEHLLQDKTLQQEQLLKTARSLTESLDLREVLERIGQSAKNLLSAYGCSLYLLEPGGNTLTPMVALEDFAEGSRTPAYKSIPVTVAAAAGRPRS